MISSAGSVWLNNQYRGIDDAPIPCVMHSTQDIEWEMACRVSITQIGDKIEEGFNSNYFIFFKIGI